MSRKFRVGQRVLLKGFWNGEEMIMEETAEILKMMKGDDGYIKLTVEIDAEYLTQPFDDGIREIGSHQVKKILTRG